MQQMHCVHGFAWEFKVPNTVDGKIKLTVLTDGGQEIQIDCFGKLHIKRVTNEPYILIGSDGYSNCPLIRICKTTDMKEVKKIIESFFNFYGVAVKIKSDSGGASISKEYETFCK